MSSDNARAQIVWGVALFIVGLLMFFRIPQKVSEIAAAFELAPGVKYSIYFSFYVISIVLIVGGSRKIIKHYKSVTAGEKKDS